MSTQKEYTFYCLGSRGSRPVHGRDFEIFGGQTSCFVVKSGNHAVVVDCGTGLYDAEKLFADCEIIDIIFTHVHYDHILGLLDFSIFPQNARISFLGNFSSWLSSSTIDDFFKRPFWPVQLNVGPICELKNDGTNYNLGGGFNVSLFKCNHPDGGNVISLKCGQKKMCFLFDIEVNDSFNLSCLDDCDYLVFDGMFDESEYKDHIGWGHSTYQAGCSIASICKVQELFITHHSPKNDDKKLLQYEANAKLRFSKTRFCRAGDIIALEK